MEICVRTCYHSSSLFGGVGWLLLLAVIVFGLVWVYDEYTKPLPKVNTDKLKASDFFKPDPKLEAEVKAELDAMIAAHNLKKKS